MDGVKNAGFYQKKRTICVSDDCGNCEVRLNGKKFASGNGSAKKDVMIKLFESIFPNLYLIPKIDDIADSYWMCEYVKSIKSK